MRTFIKVILIFILLMIGGGVIAIINKSTGRSAGGGPVGVIVSLGIIAAIYAIWRWKPVDEKKENNSNKNQQLDKH
jgi:hypothetical protein